MQYRFSNFSGYNRYIPDAYFSCLPAELWMQPEPLDVEPQYLHFVDMIASPLVSE